MCVCVCVPPALPQVAVCNLASIALNMYVTAERTFDFQRLAYVTKVIVKNLNKVIDVNFYPVVEVASFPLHSHRLVFTNG